MIPSPEFIRVFIGYDPKEPVAYHVCSESIIRRATQPVYISPLALGTLGKLYDDKWHNDGSNEFIYSRFLVPWLCNWQGWAIYIDGDMIVRDDIVKLWEMRDPSCAVQVVKHNYKTKHPVKYLGNKNPDYPMKNWSSVIIYQNSYPAHRCLTPTFVGQAAGSYLHRFEWLRDDKIGALPPEWNHLAMELDPRPDAKLVHYTIGIPAFQQYATQEHAGEWFSTLDSALSPLAAKF